MRNMQQEMLQNSMLPSCQHSKQNSSGAMQDLVPFDEQLNALIKVHQTCATEKKNLYCHISIW